MILRITDETSSIGFNQAHMKQQCFMSATSKMGHANSMQRYCENRSIHIPSCQLFKSFIAISPFKVLAVDIQIIFIILSPGNLQA